MYQTAHSPGKKQPVLAYKKAGYPETVVVPLTGDSIATWFYNFGLKFVFFDNICDWETDLSQVSAFTPVRLKTKIIEPEPILETVSMPVVEYEQTLLSI